MYPITRTEIIEDRHYTWAQYEGLNCIMLESDHELTQEEVDVEVDKLLHPVEEENGTTD